MILGKKPWEKWLETMAAKSEMSTEQIDVDDKQMGPWKIRPCKRTGYNILAHDDDKFMEVKGILVYPSKDGKPFPRIIFGEVPKGGYVVVPMNAERNRFLIAAREEPGNSRYPGRVLLGAACQMSVPNMKSEKPPARKPWVEGATLADQSQDGDRWDDKVNRIGYTVVDSDTELLPNERWFTREELKEALAAGKINSHLAEALLHLFI